MSIADRRGRALRNLRLSITDRCNLRCAYCMPEENYVWLPRKDLLDFEELARLVAVFASVGVDRVRLTGGEPLLRRDVCSLVEKLRTVPGIRDLALTTNGVLLAPLADGLKRAGLSRITVSLDTLRPERFVSLTRRDSLSAVLDGIEAVAEIGLPLKLDTVLLRGTNDDEVVDLLRFAASVGAELRFIEYMDVGGATEWAWQQVVPRAELLERIADALGGVEALHEESSAPAERFRLPGGQVIGVIASTTAPFCQRCDRSRVTADGMWYQCLYAAQGMDLRGPLRAGESNDELRERISNRWRERMDQGAVERLDLVARGTPYARPHLAADPHLEMHTRGG